MRVRHVLAGLVLLFAAASAAAQTRPATPTAPPAAAPAGAPIDLNSASRDDLMSLDGIGEVRAEAIIREAVYDKIADRVIARPPPGAPPPTNRPPAGQPRRT